MFTISARLPTVYRTFISDNVEPHIHKLQVNNLCLKADILGPLLERDSYSSILAGYLIFAPWAVAYRLWGNPWKGVLVLDSGFCGVDSGFPDSVPVELGFWITGSRIQDSLECVPDFQNQGFRIQSRKNFPDSVIRILFHGATLCNVM